MIDKYFYSMKYMEQEIKPFTFELVMTDFYS